MYAIATFNVIPRDNCQCMLEITLAKVQIEK